MLFEIVHVSLDGAPPDLLSVFRSEGIRLRCLASPTDLLRECRGLRRAVPLGILLDRHSTCLNETLASERGLPDWPELFHAMERTAVLNGTDSELDPGSLKHVRWLPAANEAQLRNSLAHLLREYFSTRMRRLASTADSAELHALDGALHTLREGVLCISPSGRILFSNAVARALSRGQQSAGMRATDPGGGYTFVSQDGTPIGREGHPWYRAVVTRLPVSDVILGVRLESALLRFSMNAFPVADSARKRVRFIIQNMRQEIEGSHAVIELERTREHLEKLLATIPSIIYVVDVVSGVCRFENDQIRRLLGYTAEQIRAGGPDFLVHIMHDEDREAFLRGRSVLMRENAPVPIDRVVRLVEQSGRVRWVHLREAPFDFTPAGHSARILGTGVDITEAMESSRVIGEQNLMFSGVFDHSPIMLLLRDDQGRVLVANQEFRRVTGFSSIDVLGKTPAEFLPVVHREAALAALEKIRHGERYEPFEADIETLSGSHRHIRLSSVIIRDMEGEQQFIVTALEDLTEYRNLQEQLAEARKMEALGSMAGGVAHDFNNILQGISNFQELLKIEIERLSPSVDAAILQRLHASLASQRKLIDRGADITGQILEFSRTKESNPVRIDLRTEVAEFRELFSPQFPPGVVQEYLLPDEPMPILANRVSFQRLLQNLFSNAARALARSSVLIFRVSLERRRLEERPEGAFLDIEPGEYVQLRVYDSGCGIPEENLHRIFDPFFSDRTDDPGTGLGLAVVYAAVRRMKGTISVRSQAGKFTEFSLFIPLYIQNDRTGWISK